MMSALGIPDAFLNIVVTLHFICEKTEVRSEGQMRVKIVSMALGLSTGFCNAGRHLVLRRHEGKTSQAPHRAAGLCSEKGYNRME